MFCRICNQSGMSLVNVLVAMAISAIVFSAMTSAIVYSNKETRNLEAKLATLELQRTLTSISPGINICQFAVTGKPAYVVPNTSFLTSTFSIPQLALDAAGKQIIAANDTAVLGVNQIKAKNIRISDMFVSGSNTIGNLTIEFDSDRSIKPLSIKVIIQSSDDGKNTTLQGCSASPNSGGGYVGGIPADQASCEAAGGVWVDPGGGRPAFCNLPNDILEWF